MRDRFIMGLEKGAIMERLFEEKTEKLTFQSAIEIAAAKEAAKKNFNVDLGERSVTAAAGSSTSDDVVGRLQHVKSRAYTPINKRGGGRGKQPVTAQTTHKWCTVCGKFNHTRDTCKYKQYKCNFCNKTGHLIIVCKLKSDNVHNYLEDDNKNEVGNVNVRQSAEEMFNICISYVYF